MTGGLVQEFSHAILPDITPLVTIILTLVFIIPGLIKLWSRRGVLNFIRGLVLGAMTSFLFGWHVHEKAILMVIIPLRYSLLLRVRIFSLMFLIFQHFGCARTRRCKNIFDHISGWSLFFIPVVISQFYVTGKSSALFFIYLVFFLQSFYFVSVSIFQVFAAIVIHNGKCLLIWIYSTMCI